jgi:hypothetical protein
MARASDSKGAAKAAPTLDELAAAIREESKAGEEADLTRAIRLGEMLRQAREKVSRGGWRIWLETNYVGSPATARRQMRIADPKKRPRVDACKSVREAEAAISKKTPVDRPPKRKAREAGKRLRALHALKREKDSNLVNARINIVKMVGLLEGIDLPTYGFGDADDETVKEIHDELSILFVWLDRSLKIATAAMSQQKLDEKIRKLREDTTGRSPDEIETALRLAARLERKQLQAV